MKSDFIGRFVNIIVPYLTTKFILVTHNSDKSVPKTVKSKKMLRQNPLLIKWFAQNPAIVHPKLIPIPIGMENLHYHKAGKLELIEKLLRYQ